MPPCDAHVRVRSLAGHCGARVAADKDAGLGSRNSPDRVRSSLARQKKNMTKIKLLVLPLLVALGGCATSLELQDSAVDPAWQGREPERVMVIGLDERRYRSPFERTFVDELRSRGFDAVVSTTFAPALKDFDDEARFDEIIEASRADSLLTVKAVGFRQPNNDAWAAGYVLSALFADNYRDYRQMRGLVTLGAAADNVAAAHYGLEVQFFDVEQDHMIWTAKTRIFDGGDLDDLVVQLADLMIDDLIAKGVIRP